MWKSIQIEECFAYNEVWHLMAFYTLPCKIPKYEVHISLLYKLNYEFGITI